jgi:ferric-dicitrate binding protein FerR (iron transport regulator)
MSALRCKVNRCHVYLLAIAIAIAPAEPTFGASSAHQPVGSAVGVNGADVQLNGAQMSSGATLFPGDDVRLGVASSIALQVGKNLVLAARQTQFTIELSGVTLRSGSLVVRGNGEEPFHVLAPFFHVNIGPSAGAPGAAEISASGTHAQVFALSGLARLSASGGAVCDLHAGETATLDAAGGNASAGQSATSPAAGQVSRLVPEVQIERASQRIVAAASAPVFWNDSLSSGPSGRAHITLTDGSLLNLGSDSTLRILQHDAQAQQTSLDLVIGRMRGRVVKLTHPGAKFEIRTPVGVAGLVGTDFSLLVTADYVELMVFEGVVRFAVSSSGQAIDVTAGRILRISRSGIATGPQPATSQELQVAKDLTDISGAPVQSASSGALNSPLVPIIVSLSIGVPTVVVGAWIELHTSVSPIAPN